MDPIDEKFEFLDFEPDAQVKGLTSQILAEVLGHAPSDATPTACLVKTRDGFEASLKLRSLVGTFAAQAAANSPLDALEALGDRMLEQISDWRHFRFHREAGRSMTA